MSDPNEPLREKIAVAISGAPFPSVKSLKKADAILQLIVNHERASNLRLLERVDREVIGGNYVKFHSKSQSTLTHRKKDKDGHFTYVRDDYAQFVNEENGIKRRALNKLKGEVSK